MRGREGFLAGGWLASGWKAQVGPTGAPGEGPGTVRLSAIGGQGNVRIRVQDTGAGIDPDDLPRVFERPYRADKSPQRDGGASGLGLAIARSIVVGHGGKIWPESAPGAGTTVVVELPAGTGEPG